MGAYNSDPEGGLRIACESKGLDACFQSTALGVALLDSQLRYIRVNSTLAALNRHPPEAHINQKFGSMAPLLAELVEPRLDEVLATRRALLGIQIDDPRCVIGVLDLIPFGDGALVVLVDTTELHQQERSQRSQLRLSNLISEVSASFIDIQPAEFGRSINTALKIAGEALDCDRGFVGLFTTGAQEFKLLHTWTRGGAGSGESPSAVAIPASTFRSSLKRILAGHDFIFESRPNIADPASEAPGAPLDAEPDAGPDAAQRLIRYGVQALVLMPLRLDREIVGFVGFASTRSAGSWQADVLTSLRMTVEIIASALARKSQDSRLSQRIETDALVARVSHEFVAAQTASLDQVLPGVLATIGEGLGLDRALIYRRDPTSPRSFLWHEWLTPGVASMHPEFTHVDRTQLSFMPPEYLRGEAAIIDMLRLSPQAPFYAMGRNRNIRVLSVAPLLNAGQNFGSLVLHERSMRAFSEDFRGQVTLLGQLFASVISRIEAERDRERMFKELEALKARIERERDYLREELRDERELDDLIGESPAMRLTLEASAAVAATEATVLIRGESGVGKELIARAIHEKSPRRDGPLIKVNCAAIPRELFESEFFGHARGSFTGAHKERAGRFELADRGTLFLDEVGDIPLDLQAKLLRVLQEGEYERIGEERTRKADVRIVAATNRELEKDIAAGRFRLDLYYRLSTFPLEVPPLRARGHDVIRLARHFLHIHTRSMNKPGLSLDLESQRLLCAYDWPGNVRELRHVMERAVILSSEQRLRLDLALPKLPSSAHSSLDPTPGYIHNSTGSAPRTISTSQPMPMSDIKHLERENVLAALERTRWRISGPSGAANLLGINPSTLRDRMRALGIARGR